MATTLPLHQTIPMHVSWTRVYDRCKPQAYCERYSSYCHLGRGQCSCLVTRTGIAKYMQTPVWRLVAYLQLKYRYSSKEGGNQWVWISKVFLSNPLFLCVGRTRRYWDYSVTVTYFSVQVWISGEDRGGQTQRRGGPCQLWGLGLFRLWPDLKGAYQCQKVRYKMDDL